MTNQEKYDHAKFIIERFDHYNDNANNKGAFYIGVNTFLLSGLCAGYLTLYKQIDKHWLFLTLIILFGLCCIISSIITIFSINPFLVSGDKEEKVKSMIFFGSVAKFEKKNYQDEFLNLQEDRALGDIVSQSFQLACGLNKKYKKLKITGWMTITQFILLLPIIYFITTNLLRS